LTENQTKAVVVRYSILCSKFTKNRFSASPDPRVELRRCPLWKKFVAPESSKVHPWSPDLSPIDRSYASFYRHSALTFILDCFVSEISLVLYYMCHFCTYRLVFHQKFGYVPLEYDRWAV